MLFLSKTIRSPDMKTYSDKCLLLTGLRELSEGKGLYWDKMPIAANKSMRKLSPLSLSRHWNVWNSNDVKIVMQRIKQVTLLYTNIIALP